MRLRAVNETSGTYLKRMGGAFWDARELPIAILYRSVLAVSDVCDENIQDSQSSWKGKVCRALGSSDDEELGQLNEINLELFIQNEIPHGGKGGEETWNIVNRNSLVCWDTWSRTGWKLILPCCTLAGFSHIFRIMWETNTSPPYYINRKLLQKYGKYWPLQNLKRSREPLGVVFYTLTLSLWTTFMKKCHKSLLSNQYFPIQPWKRALTKNQKNIRATYSSSKIPSSF